MNAALRRYGQITNEILYSEGAADKFLTADVNPILLPLEILPYEIMQFMQDGAANFVTRGDMWARVANFSAAQKLSNRAQCALITQLQLFTDLDSAREISVVLFQTAKLLANEHELKTSDEFKKHYLEDDDLTRLTSDLQEHSISDQFLPRKGTEPYAIRALKLAYAVIDTQLTRKNIDIGFEPGNPEEAMLRLQTSLEKKGGMIPEDAKATVDQFCRFYEQRVVEAIATLPPPDIRPQQHGTSEDRVR